MSFLFKKIAATDAAEYRIVHAKGVGKWWVEPNVSMFGGEWGKGRKEFATREEAEKYAKGTGKTYIVHDECEGEDAAEFKVGDKIWVDPSYGANLNIGYGWNVGIVKRVGTGNIDVDFKGQVISVPAPYCARVNSSGKPVFDSAAQDRGDYYTNSEALLRMALGNLRNASRVVRQATSNISDAMFKVKDEQTKGFLKRIYQSWARCYKEFEDVIHEAEMIAIPTAYGIPHKEKIPPEERDLLKEFFE